MAPLILWSVLKSLPTRGVWWDWHGYLKGLPSSQPPKRTHTPGYSQHSAEVPYNQLQDEGQGFEGGGTAQGEEIAKYLVLHKHHITCLVPIRSQFLTWEQHYCRCNATAGVCSPAALQGETRARHWIPQVKRGTAGERLADTMSHAALCLFAKKPASVSALCNQQPIKLSDMSYICFVLLFSPSSVH